MSFEWDEDKRRLNLRKHRVECADALSAFEDPEALTLADDATEGEDRFVTLGRDLFGGCWLLPTRGEATRFA